MTRYERLLAYAHAIGLFVYERRMNAFDGLICGRTICIDPRLSGTSKTAVLAEELSHYLKNAGDILDLNDTGNRKQEQKARRAALDLLIRPDDIEKLRRAGVRNTYEAAELLDLPEEIIVEYMQTQLDWSAP